MHWERVNWDDAQRACEYEGKNLVSYNSKEERDFVVSLMPNEWFWVGLNDREKEGDWVWNDGSPNDY